MVGQETNYTSYVAIVVIIVSIALIGINLTGRVTDTATVNITVETVTSINFTTDTLNFSNGSVTAGFAGETIDTESGATSNSSFTSLSAPLVLENIGNQNVSVNLSSDKDAAAFIGGTNPQFKYKITNSSGEDGACAGSGTRTGGYNTNFGTGPNDQICTLLDADDARDSIDIDVQLFIPSDSFTGTQSATITATATAL